MRIAWFVVLAGCGRIGFASDARATDSAAASDTLVDVPSPPAGLIGWWKLDEGTGTTVADSQGTANGLLSAGATVPPSWTVGHQGQALSFTGDADDVNLGAPLALANLPALTISGWVKPATVLTSGFNHCIADKGAGTIGWVFVFSWVSAGDVAFLGHYPTSSTERASGGALLTAGVWQHVVATWDGSRNQTGIHLFVDGAETTYAQGNDGVGTRGDDSGVNLTINCFASFGTTGVIDDVQLFDRVLSPAEVAQL